jgi:hypothetical protein
MASTEGKGIMLSRKENELIVDSIVMTDIKANMRMDQLYILLKELEDRIEKLESNNG